MKIIQTGSQYRIADLTSVGDKLEPGNYLLNVDPSGYYLTKKEDFKLPKKIYGDHHEIDRWLKSYENNSEKNLGIIFSGLKGTGKTITCHMLCQKANKPVIMINDAFRGTAFIDFITNPLFNDSIIFVDEYEKIYQQHSDDKSPNDFLSLMDGNYSTRLLFLLTVNEMTINSYLINRPGRIKYRKNYDNLPEDVLNEVIDDMLVNKKHKGSIIQFFDILGMVTYDLVVCLIKEMNLFNEDAIQCAKYLNLKVEDVRYEVEETLGNGSKKMCGDVTFSNGKPFMHIQRPHYFTGTEEKDYEDAEDFNKKIILDECDIKKYGMDMITIITPDKYKFVLTRKPNYYYAF